MHELCVLLQALVVEVDLRPIEIDQNFKSSVVDMSVCAFVWCSLSWTSVLGRGLKQLAFAFCNGRQVVKLGRSCFFAV